MSLCSGLDADVIVNSLNRFLINYEAKDVAQLVVWYNWHNGQNLGHSLYPQDWRLMTLRESIEAWEELSSPQFDGLPFKKSWWPLMEKDSDYIVFDVAGDKPAALRSYFHDLEDVSITYDNIESWAKMALDALKIRGAKIEINLPCEIPTKWGRIDTTGSLEVEDLPIGSLIMLHMAGEIQRHLDWRLFLKIGLSDWLASCHSTPQDAFSSITKNISWEALKSRTEVERDIRSFFSDYNERYATKAPKSSKVGAFVGLSKIENAEEVILGLKQLKDRFFAQI